MRTQLDRRRFLQLGAATTAGLLGSVAGSALGLGSAVPWAGAQGVTGAFRHGVASGDPLPTGVMLWTRVTVADAALPGSGVGGPADVGWEVAEDREFAGVVASGTTSTSAAQDHTVKVDVTGLAPHRDYFYRFTFGTDVSPVGRATTTPAAGESVDCLRYGVVSCSKYQSGFFAAYRHLATRDDLDGIIHLGDYIYESASSNEVRLADPDAEIISLSDYRRRYAIYRSDVDLQSAHARYSWFTTIDDHETVNDAHADGAANHDPATEGDYLARKAAALQAHFEWMPLRPPAPDEDPFRIYRRLRLGDLGDLVLLDLRSYRDPGAAGLQDTVLVTSTEPGDADRTILGAEQRAWLARQLDEPGAQWMVLGNSVMFSPLVFADLPDLLTDTGLTGTLLDTLDLSGTVVLNGDQWDGYQAEQTDVGAAYAARGGVVVLTGDIHSSWAIEVPVDPGGYLPGVGGETAAVEFVTPAVTSNGFSRIIADTGLPGGEVLADNLGTLVPAAQPWVRYLDAERQGFGVFEIAADAVQFDWHHLADRTDVDSGETFSAAWRSPAGSNKLAPTGELAARARTTGGPAVEPGATPDPTPAVDAGSGAAGGSTGSLPATGIDADVVLAASAAAVVAAGAVRRVAQTD